jgi:predicted HTH transcriptional regulator
MTEQELRDLIARGETPTVEFKSDQGPLSDADLIETVVCLANGQGGTLLVGVENDGTVTGLHAKHRTHPAALAAFVASRTVPPVSVEVEPSPVSPEEAILAYVETHGRITRRKAITVTGLSEEHARYQLRKLTESGALELVGTGRGAYYRAPQTRKNGDKRGISPFSGRRPCSGFNYGIGAGKGAAYSRISTWLTIRRGSYVVQLIKTKELHSESKKPPAQPARWLPCCQRS